MRTFEDFPVGASFPLGPATVTADEIVAFARDWDPQPFHLDAEAAAGTLLGGLAASGWHTTALMMRMICDAFLLDTAALGAPGIEEVRWRHPVRPGDTLAGTATVTAARPSASRPGVGIVHFAFRIANAAGEEVCAMTAPVFVRRREGAA